MDVLVSVVANAGEDAQIRVAGVVDKARGAAEVLAVDFERGSAQSRIIAGWVGELVQREEVDFLVLGDG
jgi:hypothetical protein